MRLSAEEPLRRRSGASADRRHLPSFSFSLPRRCHLHRFSRMKPVPLTQQPEWRHLPRLAPEFYRAFAVVQWTITMESRSKGWLDDLFHVRFREMLLHAAVREGLFCPAYVLMPDHAHLIWMGMRVASDQRNAMKFLRKHLATELARRSPTGVEFELQKQSHDSVLREKDRVRGAFAKSCFYVVDNPRRMGLVGHPREWPHLGALLPRYPFLHPLAEDFWEKFWKLYQQVREPMPKAAPRPAE